MTAESQANKRSILACEILGTVLIVILGSVLHFAFEWSGGNQVVGAFSALNESVWTHL